MSGFKVRWKNKELIVFDLDGTLTPSKSPMERDMSRVLAELLAAKQVAVIGGGRWEQFKKQFIARLRVPPSLLTHLFVFPTSSTSFYRYVRGRWKKIYAKDFSAREKKKIMSAFARVFKEFGYVHPKKVYGKVLEDRGSQITFSALGQDIASHLGMEGVRKKERWHKTHNALRVRMMRRLQTYLPEFEVRIGGLTSIDVTRKGIDKAYGVRQIRDVLRVPIRAMLFVGDALYPGGNDHAARRTGVECVQVKGPAETKRLIRKIAD